MEKKNFLKRYPLLVAVLTQVLVLFFLRNLFWFTKITANMWSFIFLQGLFCAIVCQLIFKLPKWFIVISFLFPICFSLAWSYLHISASIYGIVFIFLAMTFSHTLKERVPLYLSNTTTHAGLKKIVFDQKAKTFLDLGSGMGGVVRALSDETINSVGVESAPALWFFSNLWSKVTNRGKILRKNIWNTNFQEYDVVYAFLSPAIMEKLFEKVQAEMKPGSLFISNSFAVPHFPASKICVLEDSRETKLYLYQL